MSRLEVNGKQASVRHESDAPVDSPALDIFISYRREDTDGQALLLYKALADRFGSEHVFIDVARVRPGMSFVRAINDRVSSCDVLIAVVGPRWTEISDERKHRRLLDQTEDYVKLEIEAALRREGVETIPVLINDAKMPSANELPRPLRRLSFINATAARHTSWDADVQKLIELLEELAADLAKAKAAGPKSPQPAQLEATPSSTDETETGASSLLIRDVPDAAHYAEVARWIAEDGNVVPFLGPGVNAGDRDEDWHDGCDSLPDAEELARILAKKFSYPAEPKHLSEVSQYVFMTKGRNDLYRALRQLLTKRFQPGSVHRFLAAIPGRLEELGFEPRYQLIVTTNYDDALERAFDDANESYDLAVYMASGDNRGKFLHVPFEGDPHVIDKPNEYGEFPIDEYSELERTVIVKIYGATDNASPLYPWRENYVITEDNYIDYLSKSPVESLIPFQILNKLKESHFLFLGYALRDWTLRVILQRIWGWQQRLDRSSAIQRNPGELDRECWNEFGVDLYSEPLAQYVEALDNEVVALANARARP